MKVIKRCERTSWNSNQCVNGWNSYKGLDNSILQNVENNMPFYFTYPLVLADGMTIAFRFQSNGGGGFFWTQDASVRFTVDVNGKKGPNKLGRDVFLLYLRDGKIVPNSKYIGDCETNKTGLSCAYRVLTEGGMNY